MSIHSYKSTLNGKSVELRMGWDRPLQYLHCIVMNHDFDPDFEDEDGEGDDIFVFSNMLEPNSFGFSLEDYERILAELGLTFPNAMLEQCKIDQERNAGNRFTQFNADGTFTEVTSLQH